MDFDALESHHEPNLFPVRPRRRAPSARPVAVLPLVSSPTHTQKAYKNSILPDTYDKQATQPSPNKHLTSRWTDSETLVSKTSRMDPIANSTTIPHANLLISPSTYLPDTLLNGNPQAPACHELVDSGFVGFGGGYAEHESEPNVCRPGEFLWEHEVFDSPHSPKLTSTPFS